MKWLFFGILLVSLTVAPRSAWSAEQDSLNSLAKNVDELTRLIRELQHTIQKQQIRIDSLEQANHIYNASNGSSASPQQISPAKATLGATTKGSYLPEIGVIADIVGTASRSKEDAEGNDRISARDVELVVGHDVDPYSRLDATIVFSDAEEPSLEEAYASFWDLPLDSKLRFGRIKPKIGIVGGQHRDSLNTVDVPLVIQRYFGAEGLSKSGFDITGFTPLSTDSFTQELTLGVLEGGGGEDGQLLGDTMRIPTIYSKLKNSLDITPLTSTDLGITWINGSSDSDSGREINTVGIDATISHYVTPKNKLTLQNEFYINRDNTWGYYSLMDYRLEEPFGIGTRWDWLKPITLEKEAVKDYEQALTWYLTFFQSEFARWRVQYQHSWLPNDSLDNRVFLQGTFAIGTHKHSIQ